MKSRLPPILLALMLATMAALMLGPMRDETATVDETTFMGGGYARLQAGTFKMAEENPILIQMLIASPMLACDVQMSDEARAVMEMRAFSPVGWRWRGPPAPLQQLFPHGVNWYHNGLAEAQYFGRILVYDPRNNAEALLFWSRFTQLLLTLATTVFVFFWARQLSRNEWAGVMAAALWAFNPNALAYGHLAITEPGIALMLPVAVWWFAHSVQKPTGRNVFVLGVVCALAMEMKFLALLLGPTFPVLLGIGWVRDRKVAPANTLLKWLGLVVAGFWVTLLVIYFPHWGPPPPVDAAQADALNVPGWFRVFRPFLIPGSFFKAVTLKLLHSQAGHDAYLMGEWSKMGWWYYYPVAMWFKTPIPLLVLIAAGAALMLRRIKRAEFAALVPWVAAAMYVGFALTSKIDLGVRHMMPVYPLLAVGIAVEFARANKKVCTAAWLVTGWLAAVAVFAYPYFLPYCNEFAGGTEKGYQCLIDSNYDWGQGGKRLKKWMVENKVEHVYLDFYGTQSAIEWHKIPNTRVTADLAKQIRAGVLVVSVSSLMRPEWQWLRASHQPIARVAHTLFVYQLP